MTKHEFISKLLSLFTYATSKDEYGSLYDCYSRILTKKINYDKLWDLYSQNFGKYPPAAKELKEMAQQCYNIDTLKQNTEYLHVDIYNPIYKAVKHDVMPANTNPDDIVKIYEKKFNTKGFKIIKIEKK